MKSRNMICQRGTNVKLLLPEDGSEKKEKHGYGVVISMAVVNNEVDVSFPMLKVAWYYDSDDALIQSKRENLFPNELVLSEYEDWNYF